MADNPLAEKRRLHVRRVLLLRTYIRHARHVLILVCVCFAIV